MPGRDAETAYVASHLARAGLILNGATELTVTIAGRPVDLRAIARRASVDACVVGGAHDPVPVMALALQSQE